MKFRHALLAPAVVAASLALGPGAQAAVVSISGPLSTLGAAPAIIAAPADVSATGYANQAIEIFDELQGVTLAQDLAVDGGVIAAGTIVDSHFLVFNKGAQGGRHSHGLDMTVPGAVPPVEVTFDGAILGLMTDFEWTLVEASNAILGLPGVDYGDAGDPDVDGGRGLDFDPFDGDLTNDFYTFSGSALSIGLRVVSPGDWIRIVTVGTPLNPGPPQVPVPAAAWMLGGALVLLGGLRSRRRAAADGPA